MAKITIKNSKNLFTLNLKELFIYKDLFWILAYRDLKIRYAQTFLGPAWVLFQPLVTVLILTLVFDKIIKVDTGNIPYPLFAFAGMCGWNYFSSVLNQSGASIIGAQSMISKIYFPRLIIPLSKAVVGFVDFAIVLLLFFITMLIYGIKPGMHLLFLPLFIFIIIIVSLAIGLWLSAITVRYRDLQVVVPFMVQFGLYATPVAYPVNMIPSSYQPLFYLNPMTGIVQGFRWSLLGIDPPGLLCLISYVLAIILFVSGLFYFKKTEKVMADIL